jgi:hypothetical protein
MSKSKARVFVPLTKVDEEKRLVYGTITQEVLDKSGEMMDYATSKPNFEKWSNDIETASGGLSKGNVRVMHGLSVAGKLTDIGFDDDAKAIDVCAKVVDDAEWNKVLEGCYTGFSVGGSYGKRWTDTVDGEKVKKFTAVPNEVSLVDNPCVPSATFSLVKADGATQDVMFKVDKDEEEEPRVTDDQEDDKKKAKIKKTDAAPTIVEPTAAQIAEKAGELAKTAGDGTTWQDHIEAAREELIKSGPTQAFLEQQRQEVEAKGNEGEGQEENSEEVKADPEASSEEGGDDASLEKTTPPGVKQVWTASDGSTFEKKADAEAHELTLEKSEPKTEADLLRERMEKATQPATVEPETPLLEDFDRLAKAVAALETPFDNNGQPKLEKGMYTLNRFSSVLSDLASLSRCIKKEGVREGNDETDSTVSDELIGAVKTLGDSFLAYAKNQITELLAGLDDEVVVTYYDYYYAAAKDDSDNQLAKDVCTLVDDLREPASERREELTKAFGIIAGETVDDGDTLSPPMQKRFDQLEAEGASFKKIATEAVEKIEELSKRIQEIEDTPNPRAPRNVMDKSGSLSNLAPGAGTETERVAMLKQMLDEHGPDGMATLMIKAAHATGGQQLSLKQG